MQTLKSGEVLEFAFRIICERRKATEYQLSHPIFSLIADDSDYHRTKRGYMKYAKACLLELDGKKWVFARGEKSGAYPADPFDSDVVALPLATADLDDAASIVADMEKSLSRCEGFNNTLIIAMADGSMECYCGSRFGGRVADNLPVPFKDLVAEPTKTDTQFINPGTLGAFVIRSQRYTLEAPDHLADAIEKTLRET